MAAQDTSADNAARLDRIENKIDMLSEAIIALARAEEKIQSLTSSVKIQSEALLDLTKRIDQVESVVQGNASTIDIINKIFWIIISAAAVAVSGMFWMQVQ